MRSLKELQSQQRRTKQEQLTRLHTQKLRRDSLQRQETEKLRLKQLERMKAEDAQRNARHRTGVLGLLDRFTGKRKQVETENAIHKQKTEARDRQEKGRMATHHRSTQAALTERIERTRSETRETLRELSKDIRWLEPLPRPAPSQNRETNNRRERPRRSRSRDGPTLKR